jgi:hypothetical protein
MILSHKSILGIDIAQVSQHAKGEVLGDVGTAIHPLSDGLHELEDLILRALRTTPEVLASEFSHPYTLFELWVHGFYVRDHIISFGTIVVKGHKIDFAVLAVVQEISHPCLARWCICASRGDSGSSTPAQRFDVLTPQISSMIRIDIGLTRFVRFVETHDTVSVAWLDQFGKIANLFITP